MSLISLSLEVPRRALLVILGKIPLVNAQNPSDLLFVPSRSQLTVYRLDMRNRRSNENVFAEKPHLETEWRIEHKGVFYYTQISGPIVAAAIVDFPVENSSPRHQILLFNINTSISLLVGSPILSVS
jgi:hypothetical protein